MKARYLFILSILAVIFGLVQWTANARQALRMRDQIVTKDLAGEPTAADMQTLEQFSHNHMNANVQFELAGSYQRAVAATLPPAPTGALYTQAQSACSGRTDSVTQSRCVTDYISKRLPPPPQPIPAPSQSSFSRQFHSPNWVPDLAGLSFLVAALAIIVASALYLLRPKSYV